MMLIDPKLEQYDLSSLKYISMMGMSVPKALMEEYRRRIPHLKVIQGYGLTEPLRSSRSFRSPKRMKNSVRSANRSREFNSRSLTRTERKSARKPRARSLPAARRS